MAWARLDDAFWTHPKVRRAWRNRAAIGLHVFAISFAAQHYTDGKVPVEFVEDQLPDKRERERAIKTLLDCELWRRNGSGFEINDYLDYNPSRDDVEARREAQAKRKRRQRAREE